MIDREKQLYLWANPKNIIGEGFIHFEFGICSPTGSTTGDTSGVTVDLNNQWVESTRKLDGYVVLMSNSNKGVANGYASMKFKFKGKPDFKIWINSYAEIINDYTIAFNMDVDYPTSLPSTSSKGVKEHTLYSFGGATSIDDFTEVDYPNDGGEHFVVVTYRKNYDRDEYDDRGYVAVKLTPLSTTWVLRSTEFIKENDKYYQRLNEIATYEGRFTGTTGNFKKGNELTPTYIQSSDANDYMLVGSGMYYKKYVYVTPVDTAINTGDYIQGDYIREAIPTVVTYTDGSTKEFYITGEIKKDKIENISAATKVEIGNTIISIGFKAFSQCHSISSFTIPNSVTSIKFAAFASCNGIKSITIPDSVTDFGDSVIQRCANLESVILGSGISSLGVYVCYACPKLSAVTIRNSSNKIAYNTDTFGEISPTAKLYVPSSLLADYQADTNWTDAFKGGIYAIGS